MCSIMGYFSAGADRARFEQGFSATISRGPDDTRILDTGNGLLGFHRLAIMGLSDSGMQPFVRNGSMLVCNGEIYGFRSLREQLEASGIQFVSDSDCEILLPLYERYGTDMFAMLDAEYALILYDAQSGSFIAARDPIGIRPLYYGLDESGVMVMASEPKNLVGICEKIMPFPPGHYYKDGSFHCYRDLSKVSSYSSNDLETACTKIRELLCEGVRKRLDADAPLAFCSAADWIPRWCAPSARAMLKRPIRTFAIGMDKDAIDLRYAREVADKHLHTDHTEILMTREEVIDALKDVIYALGTYDITTIRASMGMYLICKAIHETTDIRVLMTGEISDELFGYKYTDFAPDAKAFQEESEKRIRELHMYDVLRADRCISVHSMEARVPFGDLAFADYVLAHRSKPEDESLWQRQISAAPCVCGRLSPQDILMREKAAFSDAVGHSLRDDLQAYAESLYSDAELETKRRQYAHAGPIYQRVAVIPGDL